MTRTRAFVSAGHPEAARIAAAVLDAGGNAVDAGVAATIALCVLHSEQVQLGGVAPMLVRMAHDGQTMAIEGAGRWPAATERARFESEHGGRIPHGVLRSVVPAAPGAWLTALRRFGTMGFAELATPALALATAGFAAHDDLVMCTTQFERYYRRYAENTRIWLPEGKPLQAGQWFCQLELGATLAQLIDADRSAAGRGGRDAGLAAVDDCFYRGAIADAIVRHVDGLGGWLSRRDLAQHRTPVMPATRAAVGGGTLYTCGFWSQGPALGQTLQIIEQARGASADPSDAAHAHLVLEALKLALADREDCYGDPDFVAVPAARLLSPAYAARRAASIDPERATAGLPPAGDTDERAPQPPYSKAVAMPALPPAGASPPRRQRTAFGDSVDTSVVAVIDADGNAYTATPSDSSFDAPAVPGLGFVVSTRGAQSYVAAAHPAVLGPGRRPRVSACPMLFEGADGGLITGGGPGGDLQLQAMAQVLMRHLLHGAELDAAVRAPRVFTQSAPGSADPHVAFPGRVLVETSAGPDLLAGLVRRGHQAVHDALHGAARPSVCLVAVAADGSRGAAICDPRRAGGTSVVERAARKGPV